MHQRRIERIAHRGALHFSVEDDLERRIQIGGVVHEQMANADAARDDGNAAVFAAELMQASAKKLSEEANKQANLEKAAKGMSLAIKTSQPFNISGTPSPEIGANPSFTQAAFDLAPGQVSAPLPLLDNQVVMQMKSRSPFDEAAFQKQKTDLREKLLESNRDPYFQDYVRRVTEELEKAGKIRINPKALETTPSAY